MNVFLKRIADALDRLAPFDKVCDFYKSDAFCFDKESLNFIAINSFDYVPFECLVGIDNQKETMYQNTLRFLDGNRFNNALLWGARGSGKSSLIKAVVMKINGENKNKLCLIEVKKQDLKFLNKIITSLSDSKRKFVLYCDDLSFDENDKEIFRYLKTLLDGSLMSIPPNIVFYATSNRRHLIVSEKQDTDMSALKIKENIDEGVALSDRFGLWLGFHEVDQEDYLKIVFNYVRLFNVSIDEENIVPKALEWSRIRGSRSGRVAYQFVKSL
ncbi:MAG: hypothetical protein BWY78_01244 [Alphaproteobacteria bacterium ADurb.Bin438]|nr:MAG: hypothetical protein BWY78_01244 [Alphaproteobacteria bacterium ADurb.Bin438]